MNKPPEVSVIIPVYNGEKTLRECLESITNQTYPNYEAIVIDNNSSDKTKEIIEEFRNKNSKINYAFEVKKGRGAARNRGIDVSLGSIIAMTDADCVVPENWIEELIKPIVFEDETAVMGFEHNLLKNYWSKNIQESDWEFYKRISSGKYISLIDTKNFAIKSAVMKSLMFDSRLKNCEDVELCLRLKKTAKIRFTPDVKVGHNHKNSFISTIKLNFDRAYWSTQIYKKHKKNKDIKEELAFINISFKGFLLLLFPKACQFIKIPIGKVFFKLIWEASWRAGIIWGMIKQQKPLILI